MPGSRAGKHSGASNSPPKLGGVDASSRKRMRSHLMASGRGGSKDAKLPYRYSRSAPTNKERFAEIHKVGSRRLEPPRLRAQFWETLMRAATPPNLGGELLVSWFERTVQAF